jgi:hypothetical protein
MEYNSTLPYNSMNTFNADYEMWYLGDTPVIGGYLGDTQVYPPKTEEGGKPSDGLYMMEAGWNLGLEQSMYPGMNKVGITTTAMEGIDTFYFSRTKSSYGYFTEANIRAGEWFLVSSDEARYYGEFTGETSDDGSVIRAKCKPIEYSGEFVIGQEEIVILGYFGQFKESGDGRLFEEIIMGDE